MWLVPDHPALKKSIISFSKPRVWDSEFLGIQQKMTKAHVALIHAESVDRSSIHEKPGEGLELISECETFVR
jgi:hypothetical protein